MPSDGPPTRAEAVLRSAAADVEPVANSAARVARDWSTREDEDRSWIARTIIWIFVAVIGAAFGVLVLNGLRTGAWDAVTTSAIDLVKSAVLPVVTLVLGYYFGRSGKG